MLKEAFFVGGHPAIDFVNTEIVDQGVARDLLTDFETFCTWLEQAGLAPHEWVGDAGSRWGGTPAAARVMDMVQGLRRRVREAVAALASGEPVPRLAIDEVNAYLRRPVRIEELVRASEGTYERRVQVELAHPADLLVPVADAVAGLLCEVDPARVGKCGAPQCIRYFLDTTKNRARRWCDAASCGNRANVAAFRERRRTGSATG